MTTTQMVIECLTAFFTAVAAGFGIKNHISLKSISTDTPDTPSPSEGSQMNATLSSILALLPLFFHSNPTIDEIELILPQVLGAITGAKAGTAFSVTFPESFNAVKGNSTFSWAPTA